MINLGNEYFQMASNTKGTESIKLYIKAASEYSLSNQKCKAGLSYQLGAGIFYENNFNYQAALNYIKASNQYNGIENNRSIACLTIATNLLNITKHFKLAATNLEVLGLLNIKEKRFVEAIDSYEKASKNYKRLNMNKEAFKCLHKISTIMIQNEDYEKAIIYLEKMNSKNEDIFFDIGVLRLYINDTTACSEFLKQQNKFMLTKKYFLLTDLIIAFDQNNKSKFRKLLIDHNNIFPLQKWQFDLLINVLEKI